MVETGAQQARAGCSEVEPEGGRSLAEQEGWSNEAQPEDWKTVVEAGQRLIQGDKGAWWNLRNNATRWSPRGAEGS